MKSLAPVEQFVQHEAQLLDDRNWDEWLALFEQDVEYWVPMWDDDGTPTTDPQTELSLIYYQSRSGLEDRVFRVRGGRSSASMPLFRTCHIRSPSLVTEDGELLVARFNWVTYAVRGGQSQSYFGRKSIWLRPHAETFRIVKAHTLVQNDLIDQVLDFYHL